MASSTSSVCLNASLVSITCFLTRCAGGFEAEAITHVEGTVDPVRDIKIIDGELQLKDLETAERQREVFKKATRRAHDAEGEAGLVRTPVVRCLKLS